MKIADNMRTLAVAYTLLFSCLSIAQEEALHVTVGSDVFALSPFDGAYPGHHYFGEYAFPFELTGGTELHLFPNGQFVISKWTDIEKWLRKFERMRPAKSSVKRAVRTCRIVSTSFSGGHHGCTYFQTRSAAA
jgi:hypothetical protein